MKLPVLAVLLMAKSALGTAVPRHEGWSSAWWPAHSSVSNVAPSPSSPSSYGKDVVKTSSGLIQGHENAVHPEVAEYLGVPFAAPPVGPLRFAPPKPYQPDPNAGVYEADHYQLSCIQAPSVVNYSQPANFREISVTDALWANHTSEDCLYLNIWTKRSAPSSSPKPVLLWIYGGGFHSGSANDLSSDGALWASEQDVVIVHLSYRLNIFGFPGIPGETQNVAFLDQRLAVEWVRDNAAAFGGDPSRITLFGHSAGGASVSSYSYIWQDDPIVNGLIAESGTADTFGNRFENTTAEGWNEASSILGCGNSSTESTASVLNCMRSKSAQDVYQASVKAAKIVIPTLGKSGQSLAGITGLFGPTVDNHTVFENYTMRGNAGQFMKKPLLTGSNIAEGCFFAEQGQIPIADIAAVTQAIFTCPIDKEARWFANAGVPTWKYRFYGECSVSCYRLNREC